MRKYILLSSLMVACSTAFAQQEFDGLKFSLSDINGSARYVSMSGAFGALGGDMTSLSMNPAGIAVYRSSEFTITPAFSNVSAKSVFDKTESSDSKRNLMINNFGYVGSFRTYDETAISNFNFGIAYNKIKDFNRNASIVGNKQPFSLLDRIGSDANNTGSNLLDAATATKLVNLNGANYESILGPNETVNNSMYMMESGSIGEWDFSMGANYGHFLYLGMSLGIQSVDYGLKSIYGEDFSAGGSLELRNVLSTQGAGVNFKLGAIVRPFPELRLGLAVHTPTYYNLTDIYGMSMGSYGVVNPNPPLYQPQDGSTDYRLETPGKLMYSAAYQFGQKGFLSLDWDMVDYREITLKDADGLPYGDTNGWIDQDFRVASNVRLGGEYRLTDNVSLRGGAAWYQSPVKSSVETGNVPIVTAGTTPQYSIEKDTYYLSCGIGYRSGAFFLDAALQQQMRNEHFYNYYDGTANADYSKYSILSTNRSNLIVSLGLKF